MTKLRTIVFVLRALATLAFTIAFVMPQVINDLKARIALYGRVAPELSRHPEASLAARKIVARHQTHLEALEKMVEGVVTE